MTGTTCQPQGNDPYGRSKRFAGTSCPRRQNEIDVSKRWDELCLADAGVSTGGATKSKGFIDTQEGLDDYVGRDVWIRLLEHMPVLQYLVGMSPNRVFRKDEEATCQHIGNALPLR